jgi:hypothetical protein
MGACKAICASIAATNVGGLVERKIEYFNPDLLNWWWYEDAQRDVAPVRNWIQIGIQITILVACLFVASFGWWLPNS